MDSFGIVDIGEMIDIVLGYLIKVCVFIYIINSENVGGVVLDRVIFYFINKVIKIILRL